MLRDEVTGGYGLPGLGAENFGAGMQDRGRLALSWDDPAGQAMTVAEGAALFTVRFSVVGGLGRQTAVAVGDWVAVRELGVNYAAARLATREGWVSVAGVAGPRLGLGVAGAGEFQVKVPTLKGWRYVLECREDLKGDWTEVRTVVGDGRDQTLADLQAPGQQRFYRVRLEEERQKKL
ncbi:MAG: hypothetical protein Q7U75_08775 [Desulfobacterales bacterium]|nr:hypothetical protein [Desulfobacterales bacterium]